MSLRDWPPLRLALVWVGFVLLSLLFMLVGTVLDASGSSLAGLLTFFLASVCIAAPLILTWHWKRDRKER
jgi:preprotein translocase subunit SecF